MISIGAATHSHVYHYENVIGNDFNRIRLPIIGDDYYYQHKNYTKILTDIDSGSYAALLITLGCFVFLVSFVAVYGTIQQSRYALISVSHGKYREYSILNLSEVWYYSS